MHENKQLRAEIQQHTVAEHDARAYTKRTAALNNIIHVINEALDIATLYERALTATIDKLGFERGLVYTTSDGEYLKVKHAHNLPPEFVKAADHVPIDTISYVSPLWREQQLIVMDVVPPDSLGYRYGFRGAAIGISFISETRSIGYMTLYTADPRSFTPEEQELFQTIGLEFETAVSKLMAKAPQRNTPATRVF